MIALLSKQSKHIKFRTAQHTTPVLGPFSLLIESGVAVISFGGSVETDWTRDTLSFSVGEAMSPHNFVSGIAAASPASFWTNPPRLSLDVSGGLLTANGTDSAGDQVNLIVGNAVTDVNLNGNVVDIGCAVDSATVAYSTQAGQPVLNLALAVFGKSTFLMRVSYTVHIFINENTIVVATGGGGDVLTSG